MPEPKAPVHHKCVDAAFVRWISIEDHQLTVFNDLNALEQTVRERTVN